jgi:hypothetical protein
MKLGQLYPTKGGKSKSRLKTYALLESHQGGCCGPPWIIVQ